MALIAMAVYDLDGTGRTDMTRRTLDCLRETVDLSRHRIIVVDNNSCNATRRILRARADFGDFQLIENETNIGTAEAINLAWKRREPGEHAVKMDNDVLIYSNNWADQLEEALDRDPSIGIAGLKRKDLIEHPDRTDFYRSYLYHLPHQPGQRWIVAEQVNHVMGTCQMYSAALLEQIGYLYQIRLYGFDDALAAVRCKLAGKKSVFLPHIEIDHIDPGDSPYQKWKEKHASEQWDEYHRVIREYESGQRSIYYNPFEKTENDGR